MSNGLYWTPGKITKISFCIVPQWMRPEQKAKLYVRIDKPIKITRKKMARLKKNNYVRDMSLFM